MYIMLIVDFDCRYPSALRWLQMALLILRFVDDCIALNFFIKSRLEILTNLYVHSMSIFILYLLFITFIIRNKAVNILYA